MANPSRGGDAKPGVSSRQPSHRRRNHMTEELILIGIQPFLQCACKPLATNLVLNDMVKASYEAENPRLSNNTAGNIQYSKDQTGKDDYPSTNSGENPNITNGFVCGIVGRYRKGEVEVDFRSPSNHFESNRTIEMNHSNRTTSTSGSLQTNSSRTEASK